MKTKRNSILLVITAFVWGIGFVAQSSGGDAIGPFSFNGIRSFLAAAALLPIIYMGNRSKPEAQRNMTAQEKKSMWFAGIVTGIVFFTASSLQQVGITIGSTAGKAGFLTACYIVLVPILGIFLKKKCTWNIWIGVLLTVIGLYMLCITGEFRLQPQDILLLLCALMFAVHILVIDHFTVTVDGVKLSSMQFLVCGIISMFPTFFLEMHHSAAGIAQWAALFANKDAWIALLYAGLVSSGVGYTLQILGQKGVNPTIASLLMSLESVFAVLAGWVLLHERLSQRELLGCVLIFAAVVLAQIPINEKKGVA